MSRQIQINKKAYMPKSKSQTHLTPDKIFETMQTEWGVSKDYLYDPCPAHTNYKSPIFFNGLYGDWSLWNYVNPPFNVKTLEAFVKKAVEQSKIGNKTIMLLPTKTDQDWFHDFIKGRITDIVWIYKRLKFKNNKHHATDSHFLVLIK